MSRLHIPTAASVNIVASPAKFVLICLAWFADDDDSCSPTVVTIADWCALSRRGVVNQLRTLESLGLIKVSKSLGRTSNVFRLTLHAVQGCSGPTLHAVGGLTTTEPCTGCRVDPPSNITVYRSTDMDRFKKPDLVELKFHAVKIGLPEPEAEKFFNYYESNGWRVGKSPMKQWKSAMANWKLNWEQWRSKQTNYVNPRNPTGSPL